MNGFWKAVFYLALFGFIVFGIHSCNRAMDEDIKTRQEAVKQNPWKEPVRKITVTITLGKYERGECEEAGGTFVLGDTKELRNALIGCIEKEK